MTKEIVEDYIKELKTQLEMVENMAPKNELLVEWFKKQITKFTEKLKENYEN